MMIRAGEVGTSDATRAHARAQAAPVDVNGAAIRAYVERVEQIEGEIKTLNEDKSEVYKEAKGNGFDPAILKEIVKIRRKDPSERAEHETVLDLYLRAMNEG